MFNIGDKVVHVDGGIFEIFENKLMNYGFGDKYYYCLKPYFNENTSKKLIIYVPEENALELIRHVMKKDDAYKLIDILKRVEPIWFNDVKIRKQKFSQLYTSRNIENICIVLKSLYVKQLELNQKNKTLNLLDYDYLVKIKKAIEEEIALALNEPIKNIESLIDNYM